MLREKQGRARTLSLTWLPKGGLRFTICARVQVLIAKGPLKKTSCFTYLKHITKQVDFLLIQGCTDNYHSAATFCIYHLYLALALVPQSIKTRHSCPYKLGRHSSTCCAVECVLPFQSNYRTSAKKRGMMHEPSTTGYY